MSRLRDGLCAALCAVATAATGAERIEIGALDFPPYYMVRDYNSVSGCLPDMLRDVAGEAGLDYEVHGYPAKRLFTNIAAGKTQLWFGTKGVPEYDDKVYYSRDSLLDIKMAVYRLPATPELQKKEQLAGQSVIVIYGYAYGGFVSFLKDPANHITLQETTSHKSALLMLLNNRADYLLDYTQPVERALALTGPLPIVETRLSTIPLHFVVPKAYPQAESLLKKIELAAETLKKRGLLQQHLSCARYGE